MAWEGTSVMSAVVYVLGAVNCYVISSLYLEVHCVTGLVISRLSGLAVIGSLVAIVAFGTGGTILPVLKRGI